LAERRVFREESCSVARWVSGMVVWKVVLKGFCRAASMACREGRHLVVQWVYGMVEMRACLSADQKVEMLV